MLEADPDRRYADVMERALYNGVLSGMQLDGKKFFYINQLEADPMPALLHTPTAQKNTRRSASAGMTAPAARRTWLVW